MFVIKFEEKEMEPTRREAVLENRDRRYKYLDKISKE